MTDKELRRLSRAELVEIIYEVRKNEAALQEEVESLKKQLEEKQKKVSKAGNLAELSANINGLFEAAQATADQYLQEISKSYEYAKKLRSDTERRAAAVANQALRERKELLEQTREECRRMKEEAAGCNRISDPEYRVPKQETVSRRRSAEAVSDREVQKMAAGTVPEEISQDVEFQDPIREEQPDRMQTRELPTRKKVQETAPRKKTSPPRKSARPVTMNDRRKMQ